MKFICVTVCVIVVFATLAAGFPTETERINDLARRPLPNLENKLFEEEIVIVPLSETMEFHDKDEDTGRNRRSPQDDKRFQSSISVDHSRQAEPESTKHIAWTGQLQSTFRRSSRSAATKLWSWGRLHSSILNF